MQVSVLGGIIFSSKEQKTQLIQFFKQGEFTGFCNWEVQG